MITTTIILRTRANGVMTIEADARTKQTTPEEIGMQHKLEVGLVELLESVLSKKDNSPQWVDNILTQIESNETIPNSEHKEGNS